jgi:predicted DCC family thiol-disulfide oxidoreductase YuxK
MPGELFFDGDCGFCRRSVERWRRIVGDRGRATPYQEAAAQHPEIPIGDFRRAVQYIDETGRRTSGAQAVFESLKPVFGYGWLSAAYEHVPLFAPASDWVYREVAGHRKTATWVTRLLWGASLDLPQYRTSVWLFRRALAIIYLIAFVSFGIQAKGLIGSQGILPVSEYLDAVRSSAGNQWFRAAPTVFWWWNSDRAPEWVCWVGAALAIACALGLLQRAIFFVLFALYLSLVAAGQVFMGYQWDYLLLESGFLAIFLTPSFARVWLFRWLLFRLMFESGCVKLESGDPTWANLTALSFHYETQPLPTPLAWYAFQAPMWFQKFSTFVTFAIELAAPFLIFGPRRMKQIAAFSFISLQTMILLTGNYTFFNILAISLCLFLLDDGFWGRFLEKARRGMVTPRTRISLVVSALLAGLVLIVGTTQLATMFSVRMPSAMQEASSGVAPFGIVNSYGLFATMTTVRIEIEVQGSNDGEEWRTYVFRYKPGDPARAPAWVAPYQPRLDWQMWFAALGNFRENPWFGNFLVRLLSANPDVLHLMQTDPFGGGRPKYVRALAYEYHFRERMDPKTPHNWWRRELKGSYFPAASLRRP